ncbi:MAG: hypothetical protein V4438_02005 [Patescibacteria group bacterium]
MRIICIASGLIMVFLGVNLIKVSRDPVKVKERGAFWFHTLGVIITLLGGLLAAFKTLEPYF